MQELCGAANKAQPLSSQLGPRHPQDSWFLFTYTLAELTDKESTQRCLLVVILNVHVDHMDWLTRLLLSGI